MPKIKRILRPAYEREAGMQSRAYWFMLGHHALICISGFLGAFLEPSPSVARVIGGEAATLIWSWAFVVLGIGGVLTRRLRLVGSEIWVLTGQAITTTMLAAFVAIGLYVDRPPTSGHINYGALQTAGVILAGAFSLAAITCWMTSWLRTGRVAPSDSVVPAAQLERVVTNIINGGTDQDGTR